VNNIKAIKTLAMAAVVSEDDSYNLRYIQRWYSKEYSTPLADVEDIPSQDLLQTYFEVRYEDMAATDRKQEIERLLETEEEHRLRCREEDAEEASLAEFAKQIEINARKAAPTKMQDAVTQIQGALGGLADVIKRAQSQDKADDLKLKASDLDKEPDGTPPPDINFKFIETSEDFLDEPCGPRPVKKSKII
jgi:hypothetical protein